ncbi:MAG: hypothetical protein F6K63_21840 [Moorea sp. SIO1G6]|uniref:hypothetical protein n=1 Tax=Moorena sp. SIO1G6 TaxID=2607840 RepID=UPI0013C27549|nr:hypothetical protein [Moorena sp. SIO1G6]NET66884.1 hypothetical protein [Moorena sp. SIO1G6]
MRLFLRVNYWQNNFPFTYTIEYSIFPINKVLNTYFFRFPIPDSPIPIPDSRFPIPSWEGLGVGSDSRFPIPNSQFPNYDIHIKLS